MGETIGKATVYDEERTIQWARDAVAARQGTPIGAITDLQVEFYFVARCLIDLVERRAQEREECESVIARAKQDREFATGDLENKTLVGQAVEAEQIRWEARIEKAHQKLQSDKVVSLTGSRDRLEGAASGVQSTIQYLQNTEFRMRERIKESIETIQRKGALTIGGQVWQVAVGAVRLARCERVRKEDLERIINSAYAEPAGNGQSFAARIGAGLLGYAEYRAFSMRAAELNYVQLLEIQARKVAADKAANALLRKAAIG